MQIKTLEGDERRQRLSRCQATFLCRRQQKSATGIFLTKSAISLQRFGKFQEKQLLKILKEATSLKYFSVIPISVTYIRIYPTKTSEISDKYFSQLKPINCMIQKYLFSEEIIPFLNNYPTDHIS